MKSYISDFEIVVDLEDDTRGLPKKIIVHSSNSDIDIRWIYSKPDIEELINGEWKKTGKLKC